MLGFFYAKRQELIPDCFGGFFVLGSITIGRQRFSDLKVI